MGWLRKIIKAVTGILGPAAVDAVVDKGAGKLADVVKGKLHKGDKS